MSPNEEQVLSREFYEAEELYRYIANAAVVPVMIHVVGDTDDPRIVVTPASARAKRFSDYVFWAAGANCGEWRVVFKGDAPLRPEDPYSPDGPGGQVVGDLGTYPYSVEAEDKRTGRTVTVDPDVIVIPMY